MATTHSLRENHLSIVGDCQVTGNLVESDEVDDDEDAMHNCMLSGGSSSSTSSSGATMPLLSDAHFDYPFSRISLEEYSPLSLVDDCDNGAGVDDIVGDHGHSDHHHHQHDHHDHHHHHHHHHHQHDHVSVDDVVVIGDGTRSMSPSLIPGSTTIGGGGGGITSSSSTSSSSSSTLPNQLWSNSSTAITQNPAFLPFLLSHHHHHHYQQFEPPTTSGHIGHHGSLFDSDQLDQQQQQQLLINRPSSEPPPVLCGPELIPIDRTIDDATKKQPKRKDTQQQQQQQQQMQMQMQMQAQMQLNDGTIDETEKEAEQSETRQLIDRTLEPPASAKRETKRTDTHQIVDRVDDAKRETKRRGTQQQQQQQQIGMTKRETKRQRQHPTPSSARPRSRSRARLDSSTGIAATSKTKADSTSSKTAPSSGESSYHSSKVHLQLNHHQKLSELQQRLFGNSSVSSPAIVTTAAVVSTTTTSSSTDTNTNTNTNTLPPVSVANILAQQQTTGEVAPASGRCEAATATANTATNATAAVTATATATAATTTTNKQQQPQIISNIQNHTSGAYNSEAAASIGVQASGGLAASAPTLAALLDAGPSRALSSGGGSNSNGATDINFSNANRPIVSSNLTKKLVGGQAQGQAAPVVAAATIDFRRDNGGEISLQPGTQFGITNNGSLVTICTTNVGSYAIINPNVRITPATHCALGDKRIKLENVTEVDGNIQTTFTLIEPQVMIVANGNEFQATKALLQNGDQLKPLQLPTQADLHQAKVATTTALASHLVAVSNHGPSTLTSLQQQQQPQPQQQQQQPQQQQQQSPQQKLNMSPTNKVSAGSEMALTVAVVAPAPGQTDKLSSKTISSGTGNRQVDPNQPFRCEHCNSTFTRLGNFTRHKKIHSAPTKDGQRFKCEVCSKSFLQRCDLARHLHIHRGTEPHRCNICGKGYIRHSDLVTHQRFHNKEKPFGCPHCSKGFCQRGDLNRHLRSIHLQMKPILCPCCNRKFAKQETLLRHLNTSHRS